MALLFCEGWDKYGPANSVSATVAALLTQGEWTSTIGTNLSIVTPLSVNGFAVNFGTNSSATKTLPGNYGRIIGGVRFSSTLTAIGGIQFSDPAQQCGISINTTGTISVRNGNYATGTVLATSIASVTANSMNYLEWDITISSTGSFTVFLNGQAIIGGSSGVTGTGDTTTTANNYINQVSLGGAASANITFDDLYVLDQTGSAPLNAPLLTSPRIETQFPVSDGTVQFAIGAGILGSSVSRTATRVTTSANQIRLKPITPPANGTVSAITVLGALASATINLRPVIYTDNAGAPNILMSAGATVTGISASTPKTMPLTTPQSLVAGTTYWVGYMCDIAATNVIAGSDDATNERIGTSTFASGAPGTAPATTATGVNSVVYGAMAYLENWPQVSLNPVQGNYSYVYEANVGEQDLYSFPALSVTPSNIYAVAVKGSLVKSDAGAKTASLRMLSGATSSAGSVPSIAPGTSYAWATSLFLNDPNGGGAWTKAALDAAQAGVRVES